MAVSEVKPGKPRDIVQVTFQDGRIYQAPRGTRLEDFVARAEADSQTPRHSRTAAVMVDNRLRELTISVDRDITIQPITLLDSDGNRIYRRTLAFLLVAAAHDCYPNAKVIINHALPERAFFCQVEGRPQFSESELACIQERMRELVEQDLPIKRSEMPLDEARAYFKERGDEDKLRLLKYRTRNYLTIYTLNGLIDYFYGYMLPSTGYLEWFDLQIAPGGFVMRYPGREHPNALRPILTAGKLAEVFRQTADWLNLLKVRDIGQLNVARENGRLQELILVTEALHERRIAEIGQEVADKHREGVRLVLIAGPSSSGKTTFSKRLAIQLMTHGLKPFTLELDSYFVNREQTPRDENGDYDFESLQAINRALFNIQLQELIAGKAVQIPHFEFTSGRSLPGRTVQLSPEHIIIAEGIHGMNPDLTPDIEASQQYRIYVSALTQLNIDRHNRVSTTDVRLLRRIVRDAAHRGWTAMDTLARWPSVRNGEKRNIFPYQEHADVMFNSALVYELAVLRPLAEPHLLRVPHRHPQHAEAHRLLSLLSWVCPVDDTGIPDNSILREFIGQSILYDYHPGS